MRIRRFLTRDTLIGVAIGVAIGAATLAAIVLPTRTNRPDAAGPEPAPATTIPATRIPTASPVSHTETPTIAPTAPPSPTSSPRPTVGATGVKTVTVGAGDTLSGIAYEFDVETEALRAANPDIEGEAIYPGQVITIPEGALASPRTATPTPTLERGEVLHTVREGETLSGIAARYDVSAKAILAANGLNDADLIVIGTKLVIPASDGSGSPTPSPTGAGEPTSSPAPAGTPTGTPAGE